MGALEPLGRPVDVPRFFVCEFLQLPDVVIIFLLELQLPLFGTVSLLLNILDFLLLRSVQFGQFLDLLLQVLILVGQSFEFLAILQPDLGFLVLQPLILFLLVVQLHLHGLVLHLQLPILQLLHLVVNYFLLELQFLVLDRVELAVVLAGLLGCYFAGT